MSSKDIAINSLDSFIPSPGFILIDIIEEKNNFQASERKPDDTIARKGKILAIGEAYTNEFGTSVTPPNYKVGDEMLFTWNYNQDELEVDFKKYPVIKFSQLRGKL